ncbi:MAG TPA: zinc ribbon domain-containing protein [Polyangiaceae bacterium]
MKTLPVRAGTLVRAALVVALLAAVTVGALLGLELAILVLAGAVLTGVIALFWSSVRNLSGDTPLSIDEALSLGAPTAAEEQKRSVLRALKDLEFERSVGKISEQDYREFSARYRAEAKRLIAAVDESMGPVTELAEHLVTERLARAGLGAPEADGGLETGEPAKPSDSASPEPAPVKEPDPAEAQPSSGRPCPACKLDNDPDARFCKRCGEVLAEPAGGVPRAKETASLAEEEMP